MNNFQNLIKYYEYKNKSKSDKIAFEIALNAKFNPKFKNLYIIGDSISIDYHKYLFLKNFNILRVPVNTKSSIFGIQNIDLWLDIGEIDICLFNFGIHDGLLDQKYNPPGNLLLYLKNLSIINDKINLKTKKSFWVSSTPFFKGLKKYYNYNLHKRYTKEANNYFKNIGQKIIDLNDFCIKNFKKEDVKEDGVHLTSSGSEKIGNFINVTLQEFCNNTNYWE
mgnify:CR=1 FL=1